MNEKVLRASMGWKIGVIFLAALFIVPITFGEYHFISIAIKNGFAKAQISELLLMQLVFIPFYALSIVSLLQVFRSFIKMNDSGFEYFSGIIKHITVPVDKIKSWYITCQYTLNYHISYSLDHEKETTVKIEMIFSHNEIFGQWLMDNHSKFNSSTLDVNKSISEEIKSDNAELYDDDILINIGKYKKIAKLYNNIGTALAVLPLAVLTLFTDFGLLFIKAGYIISTLWFFAGLALIKHSKEIIRIDEATGQKFPSILRGLLIGPVLNIIPSISCINAMLDIKKFFLLSGIITIVFIAIIKLFKLNQLSFNSKSKMEKFSITCFYFLLAFFVLGNVPGVNQIFDFHTEYEFYQTKIIDKKGDDTLIVSSWLKPGKTKSIDVSKKKFKNAQIDSDIEIQVRRGALGIKYYKTRLLSNIPDA